MIQMEANSIEGVFGGIIVGQDFIEYFDHPSPAMQGFVTSVYDLGCFVGAIITLFIGEKLGRRWTMLVFTVIMGSGIIFQTASHSMTQMVKYITLILRSEPKLTYLQVWGRFIAGIGNGGKLVSTNMLVRDCINICTGNTSAAPVWHVETSHQSQKGIAVVKEMSVNVLGFVLSNFITLGCSGIASEAQWRFPLGSPSF
jgi:MFS family permease